MNTTTIQMEPVTSSQVASIGYDKAAQDLHVQFNSGGTYVYHGVAPGVYVDLMNSESVGRFINQQIKPTYTGTRPDGTAFAPAPPKAAKTSAPKPITAAVPEAAPPAKAINALPDDGEPYTHQKLVADLQAAEVLLAGFVPATLTTPQDLEWLASALAACDDDLIRLQVEYDAAADVVVARRNALRRYYEPLARKVTEQTIAVLGGSRKSIDAGGIRWSLTTQPARLQLDDQEAAIAWAKANLPAAVVAVAARTIPATEALAAGAIVEAWKNGPDGKPGPVPPGFTLIPESQKFSYKPIAAKAAESEA